QLRGTGFPGTGSHQGEVASPLKGMMRLQTDHLLARDSATNCEWQSFINDQEKLQESSGFAMSVLAVMGQDTTNFVDCTEAVPVPLPFTGTVKLPASKTMNDIEQACATGAFPKLATTPGPQTAIAPV
ncbi:class II peroxidase, partial [Sphaerobolus stellatus SS14]